jgi:hypothetical protein
MRILTTAVLVVVLSASAFAQQRGAGGFGGHKGFPGARRVIAPPLFVEGTIPIRTYGSPFGFGNVVFPGVGTQPLLSNPFSFPSTFASRLGATVSGFPGYTGAPSFFDKHVPRPDIIPYPFPVYAGGFEGGYPQQAPNVTIVMPPQYAAQSGAPVTINQNFLPQGSKPVVQEYGPGAAEPAPEDSSSLRMYQAPSAAPARQAQEAPVTFLIALKDSSVYSAVAYWVDGESLNYITPQGKHNQVSLSLVDRSLSTRLNTGNKVEFRLPEGR